MKNDDDFNIQEDTYDGVEIEEDYTFDDEEEEEQEYQSYHGFGMGGMSMW